MAERRRRGGQRREGLGCCRRHTVHAPTCVCRAHLQALEHAAWLAAEYPQHATLRAIRLDALLEMPSHLDEVSSEQ